MSQRLSRYIASVDYFDQSFTIVIGVPVGIAGASFTLVFPIFHKNCEKFVKNNSK